jgi:hypothetical protein
MEKETHHSKKQILKGSEGNTYSSIFDNRSYAGLFGDRCTTL